MTPEADTTGPQSGRPARWSGRHPTEAATAYALAYLLLASGAGLLAAALPSPAAQAVVVTAAWIATITISLLLVLSLCRIAMRPRTELLWVFATMMVFCLTRPIVFAFLGRLLGHPAAGKRIAEALSFLPAQELFGNIALIMWAAFLGKLVSRLIREGKLLLPIILVAALADIITVYWGPVAHITENAPEVAQALSASAPVAPPPGVAAPILAAVGIGDFLFLAVFLAAIIRHAMEPVKTTWAALALMLVAPFAFIVAPEGYGIPGLPFLAIAVLWANWRHLRFTLEEKRALAFAGVLVAASAVGIWVLLHR